MNTFEQFKQLLSKLIQLKQVQPLNELLQKISLFRDDYDAEMCHLTAKACLLNQLTPTALAWAERGLQSDSLYEPNRELIEQILQTSIDPTSYQPLFPRDCTMLNRTLKIVIFCMDYHVFHYTVEQFQKAWKFLGHQVFIFDCDKIYESTLALVPFLQNKKPDLLFAFNNTYWRFLSAFPFTLIDGESIPNVNFLFDHPSIYKSYLTVKNGNAITTSVDQNHVNFLKH